MKYFNKLFFLFATCVSFLLITSCHQNTDNPTSNTTIHNLPKSLADWTFIFYSNADNNLEPQILSDIQEVKEGLIQGENISVVTLFDRNGYYSSDESVFGDNFTDTRIYEILPNQTVRREGFEFFPDITLTSKTELNMGDATNLKLIIDYSKKYFPAKHYLLLIANHGNGLKDYTVLKENLSRGISKDDTDNDCIAIGEITDVLTSDQSVDIIAMDACLMGYIELAYQLRKIDGSSKFYADYMLSSSPVEWGDGFQYDEIFKRINRNLTTSDEPSYLLGGYQKYYSSDKLTSINLGEIIIEEQRDILEKNSRQDHVYTFVDLSKIMSLKNKIDNIANLVFTQGKKTDLEAIRGNAGDVKLLHYFDSSSSYEWKDYASFDIYNLLYNLSINTNFTNEIKELASDCYTLLDEATIYSYGGSDYSGFEKNKNGLAIFFPNGIYWQQQLWYSPLDVKDYSDYYGKLLWCGDDATSDNSIVENWFEMLDYFYDTTSYNSNNYLY